MEKALDLIEAGSLPHRHSLACVVVDETDAAEVELSFFDYQHQAYIGENGLSRRPFFFSARQRTLVDGRAGYVVGPEVTRFLRRDARFGVASQESRLGDVRCKVRTYVESKDGPLPVEFAVPRQDRSQGERPGTFFGVPPSPQSAPFASEKREGEAIGPWGPRAVVGIDEKKAEQSEFEASAQAEKLQECASLGPSVQAATLRERVASEPSETANSFKNLSGAIFDDIFGPAWLRSSLQNGDRARRGLSQQDRVLGASAQTETSREHMASGASKAAAERGKSPGKQNTLLVCVISIVIAVTAGAGLAVVQVWPWQPWWLIVMGSLIFVIGSLMPHRLSSVTSTATASDEVSGYDVAQNDVEAVRILREAADLGDAEAINKLGVRYEAGKGVAQDYSEAVRLFRRAANMANAHAIYNLGRMHEHGNGVAQNYSIAMRLVRKAADMGNVYAIYNLGKMYEAGCGITQDDAEALRLYRKAADMGHEGAKTRLDEINALQVRKRR